MNNSINKALSNIPDELVNIIIREFLELKSRFSRGDWGPAELKGARFAEAVYRYLEWKDTGRYTSIGKQIIRHKVENSVSQNTSLPNGLRFQVLKSIDVLFDIRNKRDVAHLGTDVDINEMDSRMVMRLASWSLAEIIREESNLSPTKIQVLIDEISAKKFPLVEEINGNLVVLSSDLDADEQALVALYHNYPDPIKWKDIFNAVTYQNGYRFRNSILAKLADARLILQNTKKIYLTQKGIAWLEKNIDMELKLN